MNATNSQEVTHKLTQFLRRSFQQSGFIKGVIAVSGGLDSATSCALAVRALGQDNVYPVLLPYKRLNEQGVTDATTIIKFLQIPKPNVTEINIGALVDPVIGLDPAMEQVRRGNIMARVRMVALYDLAKKLHALVIGTENKSEHLLGYFTRFGDEASDIEPLRNLYKTQVYELAKYLGLPEVVVNKKPTAGLWEGQTDEGEFGFTYQEADEILYQIYDLNKSPEKVVEQGFPEEVMNKVLVRVNTNSFKHNLPIIP